jgi:hypothetical protein
MYFVWTITNVNQVTGFTHNTFSNPVNWFFSCIFLSYCLFCGTLYRDWTFAGLFTRETPVAFLAGLNSSFLIGLKNQNDKHARVRLSWKWICNVLISWNFCFLFLLVLLRLINNDLDDFGQLLIRVVWVCSGQFCLLMLYFWTICL